MNTLVASIRGEYVRYKALAESALAQLTDAELNTPGQSGGNSISTICYHVSGNLLSRFTDFLTSDGEKPWRDRESEFQARATTRAEILAYWERGWTALLQAIDGLNDTDLERTVTIRQQPLRVHEALHRSLAHAAYHVGQIVYHARGLRGDTWRFLSIPPGQSAQYNANPGAEKPDAHAAKLNQSRSEERV